ncbi:MAG TPA: phosphate signaling complex protein PhoU [Methylocella sp.]|nr:phosphate signaling complex protein PhoU [Methylocella sp.]
MSDHTVRAYDQELDLLGQKIGEMGGVAQKMVSDAMESLSNFDAGLARTVVSTDVRLDIMEHDIEEQAIRTICRRQPMACDLRAIIATIRISGDLERIGDLAKSIAKEVINISPDLRMPRCIIGLRAMHELAAHLLKDGINAYVRRDAELAHNVWARDVDLDNLEDALFRDLLTFMMEDSRNISFCTHLLFCSKNIERIGDHATNIAEAVIYLVTGEVPPINRPKGRSSTSVSTAMA